MRDRSLRACTVAICLLAAAAPVAAEELYRVEVLVFRHADSDIQPGAVERLRGFHDLLDASQPTPPPAPRAIATGQTFEGLWRRLERLGAYQPLATLSWEQSRYDYHPPVRLHDGEAIGEELQLPAEVVYIDLRSEDPLEPFLGTLYRLDGSVQLRRSRFLHLQLDLEYRVPNPEWADVDRFPAPALESGGEAYPVTEVLEEAPEPFLVYRLQQSRQVRTGELHYFDTGYLGAIARVTAVEDGAP